MTMQQPPTGSASPTTVIASALGALLALIGVTQVIGALIAAVELIESDRNGGLFGFRVGMLMVLFVCVPVAMSGTLAAVGGVGAALRKRWGYIASVIAAGLYICGSLVALLFGLNVGGSAALRMLAMALVIGGSSLAVIVVMLRALAQRR